MHIYDKKALHVVNANFAWTASLHPDLDRIAIYGW